MEEFARTGNILINEISPDTSLADFGELARRLENKRCASYINKYNLYTGKGDFGETGLFTCAGLFALNKEGAWSFRHIGPLGIKDVIKAVKTVVSALPENPRELEFKLVVGRENLAKEIRMIVGRLRGKIDDENVYIENPQDDEGLWYGKKIIYRAKDRAFFVSSSKEEKVIRL